MTRLAKRKYTPTQIAEIVNARNSGLTYAAIAEIHGIPKGTVDGIIRRFNREHTQSPTATPAPTQVPNELSLARFIRELSALVDDNQRLKAENERLLVLVKKWQDLAGKLNEDVQLAMHRDMR